MRKAPPHSIKRPREASSRRVSREQFLASNQHWGSLNLSLLWIYLGSVPPGVSDYMEGFLSLSAWLVLQGEASVQVGKHKCSARKGEWLFARPVARHQKFSPDAKILSVRFRLEWPNGDQLFDQGLSRTLSGARHPNLERSARRLLRAVEKVSNRRFSDASFADRELDFLQYAGLEKNFLTWCGEVYAALVAEGLRPNLHQFGDVRMQAILEHLNAWPLAEPYRAADLARRAGLSRSHLDRLAIQAMGSSCKHYLERRRLQHALQRLRNRLIPVKQVAVETGFRHSSSFCLWFKRQTGKYPGEIRETIF